MSAPATAAIDAALARWLDNEPTAYVPIRDDILAALDAAGCVVVPREPTLEMLQDGHEAHAKKHTNGVSGMTIDAQIRAQCARVAAMWSAMLAAAEVEAKETAAE